MCYALWRIDNIIDQLQQFNFIGSADDGTVISQDNGLVSSQVMNLENDCDENTFSFTLNNNAICVQGQLT